jgi:hypothetical protein
VRCEVAAPAEDVMQQPITKAAQDSRAIHRRESGRQHAPAAAMNPGSQRHLSFGDRRSWPRVSYMCLLRHAPAGTAAPVALSRIASTAAGARRARCDGRGRCSSHEAKWTSICCSASLLVCGKLNTASPVE